MKLQNVEDIYPLSPMQQGMLFHSAYASTPGIYVEQLVCTIQGQLNTSAFLRAWRRLLERHAILRSAFVWEQVDAPLQIVWQKVDLPFRSDDWRGQPADQQAAQLASLVEQDREQGFQLTQAPLLHLRLIQIADDQYYFVWSYHHLLLDGWSVGLVLKELFLCYEAFCLGRAPRLERRRPYRDYLAWLQAQNLAKAELFWRQALAEMRTPTPLVLSGAASWTSDSATSAEQRLQLSESTTTALDAFVRRQRVTLSTLVQGAWAVLLSRYCGEADVLFGITVAGRPMQLPDADSMIGLFINTLPLRVQAPPDVTIAAWLGLLQSRRGELQQYEYCSLSQIQDWSEIPRPMPLFESIVVFENYPVDAAVRGRWHGAEIRDVRVHERTNYPLSFVIVPGDSLQIYIIYDAKRFGADTIARMLRHIHALLTTLADHPMGRLADLSLLSAAERQQILVEWTDTRHGAPQACIHDLIAAQVARAPEAVALVSDAAHLTYAALDRRANQRAHHLRARGVGPEVVVAVCMERSLDLIVCLLAILKAGGAYLPLDPAYPQQRLEFMLADTQARVLLTRSSLSARLPTQSVQALYLEDDPSPHLYDSWIAPTPRVNHANLAYIIYTSGSTGTPKGVAITHSNAIALLEWARRCFGPEQLAGVLATTSICFDLSVFELFLPLSWGGAVILADNILQLPNLRAQSAVTLINTVPSALSEVLRDHNLPGSVRAINLAGEPLPAALVQQLYRQTAQAQVINLYGPSEDTTYSTIARIPRDDIASPSIGRVIAGSQLYLLDRELQPAPIDVPGEIYLGGAGLARGYMHRPELTAERFIPNPFVQESGVRSQKSEVRSQKTQDEHPSSSLVTRHSSLVTRLYRTGDLARYRPSGELEYLGRIDQQVKLHGFRIELGEIEMALGAHPDVRAAVVQARENTPGERRLVAYVVTSNGLQVTSKEGSSLVTRHSSLIPELRAFLQDRLPDYMIPSAFVLLDALPLSPNGKVDRRALPDPTPDSSRPDAGFVAPRTPIEGMLANIWAELLHLDRVGVHDSFFDLGGHSLLVTQVVSRIRTVFELELTWNALFESPTVAELAAVIAERKSGDAGQAAAPIVARHHSGPAPLSFGQQRLWFLQQLEPTNPFYNIPLALQIDGPLDESALADSLNTLVQRHDALRMIFGVENGQPVQYCSAALEIPIVLHDLRSLPASERSPAAQRCIAQLAPQPFDLATGPLLRATLFRLADEAHILLVIFHHIVVDGWSLGVLLRELMICYQDYIQTRQPSLPPLPIQYADYALWQREWLNADRIETQLAYWKTCLAGAPAALDLTTDYPRPPHQRFCGARVPIRIPAALTTALQQLSRREGVTLFMSVLSALSALLQRYTRQDDMVIGTPIANRTRTELEGLVGLLLNLLPLRIDLAGHPSSLDLRRRVRDRLLAAVAHQDLPFEQLVEALQTQRHLSRHPLFQVLFVLQNTPLPALALPGLAVRPFEIAGGTAKYDLLLELYEDADELAGWFEYDVDLFAATTVQRLATQFRTLLSAIVAQPDQPVDALSLLTAAERAQVLVGWNETAIDYPADDNLLDLLDAQALDSPEAVAVVLGERHLTYQELHRRATHLAYALRAEGVRPELCVAVCMERSVELLVALLGILKAGGVYTPLDPSYPAARLAFLLNDSRAPVLLSQQRLLGQLPSHTARLICLDRDWPGVAQTRAGGVLPRPYPEQLVYLIYTSGSTGAPKGAMNTHQGIVNRLRWMQGRYGLTADDRVLHKTSISFDVSMWELCWPLLTGATLVLARPGGQQEADYLSGLIAARQITTLHFVPSMLQAFLETPGLPRHSSLRRIICSGEALTVDLQQRCFARLEAELHNLYGPTEAAVDVTFWACQRDRSAFAVPIGRPVANTQIYLLDQRLNPAPIGAPAELYIGGVQLARGYLGRPDLTAERFIPNPFSAVGSMPMSVVRRLPTADCRLYKTGDLARYRSDGEIEYLGRIDQQIKLRGFRIEPDEIAAALHKHPGVRDALVLARVDLMGETLLVAYIVQGAGGSGQGEEDPASAILIPDPRSLIPALRAFLAERLPAYMIPSAFVLLDAFPLTPNGKLDRQALPDPERTRPETASDYIAPQSELERTIAAVWRDVLQIEKPGLHDNFFDLGGHSLRMIEVQRSLQALLQQPIELLDLFRYPNICALADFLSRNGHPAAARQPGANGAARSGGRASRRTRPDRLEIAVVGMSGRFPGADDLAAFWSNLRDGIESVAFFSDMELLEAGVDPDLLRDPHYVKASAPLHDIDLFDAAFFGYAPREAELMDPQHRLFLECAWQALEHAGYDPATFEGPIGVFAGATLSYYLLLHLFSNPDFMKSVGGFQASIGNDKDFLATRVAYKLNLKGPSFTVQTACSTSLVALHLACQSLLNGECDMALSGGVSITLPQKAGYLYQKGGIASPDGRCRAFDAQAEGTLAGSGIGIVALKRLEDALADNDTIHAVIKATAINNDGAQKVGFTAPSVEGQAMVIAEALDLAGVAPEEISYVEAHGTATPLGDPIEVAALTQAFRRTTDRTNFCALGSVKTNIGHLDAAAGVAGLLKTILALKHKQIPPSLHFRAPNPQIDFAASPFYVNAALADWDARSDLPRRAGVSAFGLGGTNAHVVLEEPPSPAATSASRPWQLLLLSAKTPTALDEATNRLLAHIEQHPEDDLADIAYTLHVGRSAFNHRRMLACHSREDALRALAAHDPRRLLTSAQDPRRRPIVFMFPGLGDHYLHMAWDLYQTEEIFRGHVDRCAELLESELGLDLRSVLYPPRDRAVGSGEAAGPREIGLPQLDLRKMLRPASEQDDPAARLLNQTAMSHPALFVIEYALAQLLMAWGIRPDALIGYSIGEYVAACLAGVFSLEDALRLVAKRAQLIQALPEGAMLAVALAESELLPELDEQLCIAAVNSSALCVVAGPPDAINALHARLTTRAIACRRLRTEHAFHSNHMRTIAEPFGALLGAIKLRPPQIPYVSNVTGDWITAAEATSSDYWVRHLCRPVRFAEGVATLWQDPSRMLIEVGPGQSLSALALQHPAAGQPGDRIVLPSLRHVYDRQADLAVLLNAVGQLWLAGVAMDWAGFYSHERRRRIPLPAYPFERQRYWVESPEDPPANPAPGPAAGKKPDIADWFYLPIWKQSMPPQRSSAGANAAAASAWLVFVDPHGIGERIVTRLRQEGRSVASVYAGTHFSRHADQTYMIDPGARDDYDALFAELRAAGDTPGVIIHGWGLQQATAGDTTAAAAPAAQSLSYAGLLLLAQSLAKQPADQPLGLWVLASGMHGIADDDRARPEQAALLGIVRVLPQECPHITCRSIDLAPPSADDRALNKLIDRLIAECSAPASDLAIAYRGRQRWAYTLEPARLAEATGRQPRLRDHGVYLIFGAQHGIGLSLARYLSQSLQAQVILVFDAPFSASEARAETPPDDPAEEPLRRAIKAVRELQEAGAEILVISADRSDAAQMQEALEQATARFGSIHGVIYAPQESGDETFQIISQIAADGYAAYLRARHSSLVVLEQVLADRPLDFCLLTSSLSSVLGGLGLAAYTSASLCTDAFVYQHNQAHPVAWTSVNWDIWQLQESATGPTALGARLAELAIAPHEGCEAFRRILTLEDVPQIVTSTGDLHARIAQWISFTTAAHGEAGATEGANTYYTRPNLRTAYVAPGDEAELRIAAIWQELLGIAQVGIHDNFFMLGGHSLLGTRLMSRLRQTFHIDIPLNVLFEAPTIAEQALVVEGMLLMELEALPEAEALDLA